VLHLFSIHLFEQMLGSSSLGGGVLTQYFLVGNLGTGHILIMCGHAVQWGAEPGM